jgi:hypothetical protein
VNRDPIRVAMAGPRCRDRFEQQARGVEHSGHRIGIGARRLESGAGFDPDLRHRDRPTALLATAIVVERTAVLVVRRARFTLLRDGHRVRAMVHREDARSRAIAEAGAEVVVADFHDLDRVSSALRGVSGAHFCHPILPGLVEATAIFAQAATEAGVRSVVDMSQISARREAASDAARSRGSPSGCWTGPT